MRTKPRESGGWSHHISVNASRRCDIQPRPAHAAVARPMTPTDARAWIAEFIKSTSCCPNWLDTADRMWSSIWVSSSGRRDSANPTTAKPTISKGNSAKIV